ncbi:acetyl-CoA carboxylase biotin carboxyl carrier protein [Pontibacter ummariensis]|uniref:Biotin carboxyl carrier protein of acetyl-CoA carboxylase n=1 Tax=Pontibacter ummariensis TaxID=1610492 RepID=A0A239C3V2_9BACT|nr:acetyl-CoA carboxylase biotin carboxyl carrier protein [Pontibacter ummariensis]PRY15463.1 acetyl-CoA carboxylase biotin carboxyl carrier protein [Pontibacter ummariensis]SNS14810.1 acetyl-CoA carboxylase biotin carboxyl carrier protein [Pontibacter ummariensis]
MKAKEIQELIDFIAKSGLNKVNIETEEFKISVKREPDQKVKYVSGSAPAPAPAPAAPAPQAAPAAAPAPAAAAPQAPASDESKYVAIKAPMIGTFYRASSPDTPVFANVGDEVKKGQVICIIEAMKLFNEIESEVSGKIVKVLVDNASPVEYDQPLFLVDPS